MGTISVGSHVLYHFLSAVKHFFSVRVHVNPPFLARQTIHPFYAVPHYVPNQYVRLQQFLLGQLRQHAFNVGGIFFVHTQIVVRFPRNGCGKSVLRFSTNDGQSGTVTQPVCYVLLVQRLDESDERVALIAQLFGRALAPDTTTLHVQDEEAAPRARREDEQRCKQATGPSGDELNHARLRVVLNTVEHHRKF